MSKIKELKAAFEASTRTNKWEVLPTCGLPHVVCLTEDRIDVETIAAGGYTKDAEFIALAHNLMPQLLEAVDLLEQAKRALDEFDKHTRGVMIPATRVRGGDVTRAIYTLLENLK